MGEAASYFAYGANMSRAVLARRGIAPLSSEPARLDGWRLRFSHPGLLPIEPAFANLEPGAGDVVHGVLHTLRAGDLERLDRLEGAEYLHEELTVVGATGEVRARAYRDPFPVGGLRPSRRYLASLLTGAREHGLPADWLRALEAQPSLHVPLVSDAAARLVGLAERLRAAGLRPERLRLALQGRTGRRESTGRSETAPAPAGIPVPAVAVELHTDRGPVGFHTLLRGLIAGAKRRITLATLYVGTGARERELLDDLRAALVRSPGLRLRLVMDASRGQRHTPQGCSAAFVAALAREHGDRVEVALHRMPQLEGPRGWLPSPLDEVVAVFHLKVLVVDDVAVLTGANLSDEYFHCRQARTLVVRDAAFADLQDDVAALALRHSQRLRPTRDGFALEPAAAPARDVAAAVLARLDAARRTGPGDTWLTPVVQHPALGVQQERALLRGLLARPGGELVLATPYTNLPRDYLDALAARRGPTRVIVPSHRSHSFTTGRGLKALVPGIYRARERDLAALSELRHWERPGWVFHAKGVWSLGADEAATVVGSSSFGGRSVARDFDLSHLLVTRDPGLRAALAAEVEALLVHAPEGTPPGPPGLGSRLLGPLVKGYL